MGNFLKLILGVALLGLFSYLIVEILKLRNTIKILKVQLTTTESFNSNNIHSTIDVENEISEYKKELSELHSIDTMVAELETHLHNKDTSEQNENNTQDTDSIILEDENIDFETIEKEFNEQQFDKLEDNDESEQEDIDESEQNTTECNDSLNVLESTDTHDNVVEPIYSETEDINFFLSIYNKVELKKLCGDNNLSKGGSKTNLIKKLLNKNILKKELLTNNILDNLNINVNDKPELIQEHITEEVSNIEDDDSIEEIKSEKTDDIPIDSLLYNLRQLNLTQVDSTDNNVYAQF